MTIKTGNILNKRYKIVELIGRGDMAEVYKVYDRQRAQHLAMKIIRDDLAQDKIFLRRFEREAKTLRDLQHKHIVRFYGWELTDTLVFMLLDYIDGRALREDIFRAKKPFSEKKALALLDPVCKALHYAHGRGKVHCDIKPGNILINKKGEVFLTDFGIARSMDTATSTMVGIGTPAYMQPELVQRKDPTPQSDIYSLGIVLYEMLTGGERPFTGERATITGTIAEKVHWEQVRLKPESPRKFIKKISAGMEAAVMRYLQKDPVKRFTGSLALLDALHGGRSMPKKQAVDQKEGVPATPRKRQPQKRTDKKKPAQPVRAPIWGKWYAWAGICAAVTTTLLLLTQTPTAEPPTNKIELLPMSEAESIQDEVMVLPEPTPTEEEVQSIAPAPQECRIVFTSDRNRDWEIFVMDDDGDNQTQLTHNDAYDLFPGWSPDGARIAFTSRRDGDREIFVMDADGDNQTQLTHYDTDDYYPAWSPNCYQE